MSSLETNVKALVLDLDEIAAALKAVLKDLEAGTADEKDALARINQRMNYLQFLHRRMKGLLVMSSQKQERR